MEIAPPIGTQPSPVSVQRSQAIVGVIGVLMIWLGGRAILAGEMTLGDHLAPQEDHPHRLAAGARLEPCAFLFPAAERPR